MFRRQDKGMSSHNLSHPKKMRNHMRLRLPLVKWLLRRERTLKTRWIEPLLKEIRSEMNEIWAILAHLSSKPNWDIYQRSHSIQRYPTFKQHRRSWCRCSAHPKPRLRPQLTAFEALSLSRRPSKAINTAFPGLAFLGSASAGFRLWAEPCTSLIKRSANYTCRYINFG